MSQNHNVFLIDLGGTYLKGALLQDGQISSIHREFMPPFVDGRTSDKEYEPENLTGLVDSLISRMSQSFGKPSSIRVSGQMGGLILLSLDGRPITRIRSWQDSRAEVSIEGKPSSWELFCEKHFNEFYELSGRDVKSSTTVVQLFDHILFNPIEKPFRPLSLLGYVANHVAGSLSSPTVHESDAAATGMLRIGEGNFNRGASAKISQLIEFPQLKNVYGPIKSPTPGIPEVMVGVGDQQASLFGVEMEDHSVVVNIGTGGQVASPIAKDPTGLAARVQTRPYFLGSKIGTITHLPAGRMISQVITSLFGSAEPEQFERFFAESASSGPILPLNLMNIDIPANSREDTKLIARSVLTEMVNQYEQAVNQLDPSGSKKIVFAGGLGQRFSQFSDALASRTGRAKEVSEKPETTLAGLGRLKLGD